MNLSPLRQMFSNVSARAVEFYKQTIPLSGQQTVNSLKKFLTPSFTDTNSLNQNDVALRLLSQKFAGGAFNQTRKPQTDDSETFKQILSKLPPETQKTLISLIPKAQNDADFKEILNVVIKDPKFSKLNSVGQAAILESLDLISKTVSYQRMSSKEKICALFIIKDMSFYAVAHPTHKMAWNTLTHLVTGNVKMGVRNLANTKFNDSRGSYDAKTGTMYFNVGNPMLLKDAKNLMKTAAHEVNHALNSKTASSKVERFLDEYRAFYVQGAAIGEFPPSALQMSAQVELLLTHDSYNFSSETKVNPGFQKIVDLLQSKLNSGKVMTPEELRLQLLKLPGNEKSVYLNTKPNMDNH